MAETSLEEVKYYTLLVFDLGYWTQDIYDDLVEKEDEVGRILRGWIKSQK